MSDRYLAGDLTIDLNTRHVSRNGHPVTLSDLSFLTLLELIKHAPEAVDPSALARAVWKSEHVSTETIAQRIRILRRVLKDDPRSPRYIRTIRNHGYAFVATVTPLEDTSSPPANNRVWGRAGLSLALVLLVTTSLWQFAPTADPIEIHPPSEAELLLSRARDLINIQQAGETRQAIAMLDEALRMDPENINVTIALSFALSTRATKFSASEGDTTRAEMLARQALSPDAGNHSAWHALAFALDAQGRVDEALNAYRMAYELDPADGAAMSSAAYLFQVRGRIYDALMLEARAMSIRQNRYSRYADSQIALSLELIDHPGARDWRERAQRISPNNVVVLAEVAESLLRDGRPEASQTLLLSQENEIAANPRLTRLMGRAALALGDLPRAQALFERAGSRAATDLAAIHVLQGDPAMAREKLKDLEAAMLAGDTWPEMRIGAAELHAVLGNHDLAIAYVSRAVDLGWRDLAWLQKSPYLSVTSKKPGWLAMEKRIDAQIEMQSRLVSQSDLLRSVLTI